MRLFTLLLTLGAILAALFLPGCSGGDGALKTVATPAGREGHADPDPDRTAQPGAASKAARTD